MVISEVQFFVAAVKKGNIEYILRTIISIKGIMYEVCILMPLCKFNYVLYSTSTGNFNKQYGSQTAVNMYGGQNKMP
jgi:hypothetical protein